jgi:hypothetical protein
MDPYITIQVILTIKDGDEHIKSLLICQLKPIFWTPLNLLGMQGIVWYGLMNICAFKLCISMPPKDCNIGFPYGFQNITFT